MKLLFRVFEKLKQIPICLNRGHFLFLAMVSIVTFMGSFYTSYEHEVKITKTKVKMQLDSAEQTIRNRFDLAHMHIALDYVVTQTIYDSIHSLQIPYTIGIVLKAMQGDVIYKLGEFEENENQFLAKSDFGEDIYLKVPIFSGEREYQLGLVLENVYRAKVTQLPGQANPSIKVSPPLNANLFVRAFNNTIIYMTILVLLIIVYVLCVGFGQILHDQGQYKFLYRVLAAKITELSPGHSNEKELNKIANIIKFISGLERESAVSTDLTTELNLIEFLNLFHEAYKYNFSDIEFSSEIESLPIKTNQDALAAVITNSLQNSMTYVAKLPPSLKPKITISLKLSGNEKIVINISNTFHNRKCRLNKIGLGTVSISEICSANDWTASRMIRKGIYSTIIEIPRKAHYELN
ncbi:MAG: GHKL domain-containing protein [Oligoflexales bacterium]